MGEDIVLGAVDDEGLEEQQTLEGRVCGGCSCIHSYADADAPVAPSPTIEEGTVAAVVNGSHDGDGGGLRVAVRGSAFNGEAIGSLDAFEEEIGGD